MFDNLESTQQTDMLFNHTPSGITSARLNAMEDRVMGPSITLHVMPGDTVRMQVQAKYLQKAKSKDPVVLLGSMVARTFGVDAIDEAPQITQRMKIISARNHDLIPCFDYSYAIFESDQSVKFVNFNVKLM